MHESDRGHRGYGTVPEEHVLQAVDPAGAYWLPEHVIRPDDPVQMEPAGQSVQLVEPNPPAVGGPPDVIELGGHAVHNDDPPDEYVASLHGVTDMDPSHTEPGGQSEQLYAPAPPAVTPGPGKVNEPLGHTAQVPAPAGANRPAEHPPATSCPDAHAKPARQGRHGPVPDVVYVLSGHWMHAVAPAPDQVPRGHAVCTPDAHAVPFTQDRH